MDEFVLRSPQILS